MQEGTTKGRRRRFEELIAASKGTPGSLTPADGIALMTHFFEGEFFEGEFAEGVILHAWWGTGAGDWPSGGTPRSGEGDGLQPEPGRKRLFPLAALQDRPPSRLRRLPRREDALVPDARRYPGVPFGYRGFGPFPGLGPIASG